MFPTRSRLTLRELRDCCQRMGYLVVTHMHFLYFPSLNATISNPKEWFNLPHNSYNFVRWYLEPPSKNYFEDVHAKLQTMDNTAWRAISQYPDLPLSFLKKFEHKINWNCVARFQQVSTEMMREFKSKFNWELVSRYNYLTDGQIREFCDVLDFGVILETQNLSEEIIKDYIDKFHICNVVKYQTVTENLLRYFIQEGKIESSCSNMFWVYCSKYAVLTEKFIQDFVDKLSWPYLAQYQILSDKIIDYITGELENEILIPELRRYVWKTIQTSQKLSEPFLKKHLKNLDWYLITVYQQLTDDFILEFAHKLDINYMIRRGGLSQNLIEILSIPFKSLPTQTKLECCICISEQEDCVQTIRCKHTFCKNCLVTWLKTSMNCPLCRTKILYFITIE